MAVDLARSPDGQWWVLSDRTQAPSGSGYALENRTIVSDMLPELFRNSNVLRLAPFFRAQRDALIGMSDQPHPRIVLLTPGPHNETYFEHSYLAKYLGFTLVEGADMTVRDRHVYLKTVGGLEQIDVILRRVDDNFCDPLELRGDSLLGVPGLVDAIVAGNVKVANALGSGLIESAAIMPFLPGLARHLLGEAAQAPFRRNLVVRPEARPRLGSRPPRRGRRQARISGPRHGARLRLRAPPQKRKAEFIQRLRAFPHEYVAQEQVALSTAPVWENDCLNSRSMVLRTYVLNTPYRLVSPFPAASCASPRPRAPSSPCSAAATAKMPGFSPTSPVDTFSMLRPRNDRAVELRRVSRVVPSSVADNTFWLGRYVERAENIARILRAIVLPRQPRRRGRTRPASSACTAA